MTLKNAALLALVGTMLMTVLLVWSFVLTFLNVLRDLIYRKNKNPLQRCAQTEAESLSRPSITKLCLLGRVKRKSNTNPCPCAFRSPQLPLAGAKELSHRRRWDHRESC